MGGRARRRDPALPGQRLRHREDGLQSKINESGQWAVLIFTTTHYPLPTTDYFRRSRSCLERRPETMKICGERSATCRGCADFSTRLIPKPRNIGRLRYFFRGVMRSPKPSLRAPIILGLSLLVVI